MTVSLFCDTCGFALPDQATYCTACGHRFSASSSPSAEQALSPTPVSSAPTGLLPPGFLLARRYRILHQIGQGGYAIVYKAEDRFYKKRLVALKQINLQALSPQEMIDATDAYNREVTYLSHLQHENLPRIFDHFTDANNWYVAMEYIEGKTLEERLSTARKHSLSVKQTLEIGITLCTVLQYLHKQRPPIIFRDLKPANIMVSRADRLYLIDFGIARRYIREQGKDTDALGSPGYAAPEQYGQKAQTTPQTDIYGLGATLQTLLTGKEPLEVLVSGIPPERSIPQRLQMLLTRMLAREACLRPDTMDQIKQELQHLKDRLAGQRLKRTGAFIWWLFKNALLDILVCLAITLLFSLISYSTFFNSPFWLPYTLVAIGGVVGSIAWSLHQAFKSSMTREERLDIVGKYLRNSVLAMGLLGGLISIFYSSQQATTDPVLRAGELLILGMIALICIIGCLIFIGAWVRKGIRWLRRRRTSHHQTNQHVQSAPLQQQAHK